LEKIQENTIYTIKVKMAVVNNGLIYGVKDLIYLGKEKGGFPVEENGVNVVYSILSNVKVIFSKNAWGSPLKMRGARELQEHLDAILEGCYSGAYIITALDISATNDEWKPA
jgi:hypothetical protein